MLLGVAEDVTDGGEGTPVATGWLAVSLGGVPVVVGRGGNKMPAVGEVFSCYWNKNSVMPLTRLVTCS